jgi:DNA-binding NarL/FixJ family response regulator
MKQMTHVRVAVIEDDQNFSMALAVAIEGAPDMALLASAATLAEGMRLLQGPPADVMLVDLGLPDGSGIDFIRATRQAWPACDIMVFSVFGDEASVLQSIEAGAKGYLLKDCAPARMVEEIRSLCAGGSPISPRIARHVLMRLARDEAPSPDPARTFPAQVEGSALSAREVQVLNHITKGYTYEEIAQKMAISRHTVLTFVRRIYAKFEVNSKIEAINKARSKGLVQN